MANDDKQIISDILSGLASSDLNKVIEDAVPATSEIEADSESEYDISIDLREVYPYSCSPIYHNQRVHYLDKDTTRYFQQLLRQNNDRYTREIHDSVVKYASSVIPKEQLEKSDAIKPPAVVPAGYSQTRHESRMNFATDVEIEMPSGILLDARSSDISTSGLQLKVQQLLDVISGMELRLSFPQLEEQYEKEFGQVVYIVQKYSVGPLHMSLFLSRKDPGATDFDVFIEKFIQSKKHRYRIDYEDSAIALFSKAWEYLYIKALPYVACFVSSSKDLIQIQEVAISESNQRQLLGLGQSMLNLVEQSMSASQLNKIATGKEPAPEVYSFRYNNDNFNRRLCGGSWQFHENSDRIKFLGVGVEQETFVAWRVEVIKLRNLPSARSQELLSRLREESQEQAQNLVEQLNQHDYLIYLVDISEQVKREPLLANSALATDVPDFFFDEFEIKSRKAKEFTRLRLGIAKRRNESRYIYASPVVVKLYGEKINAQTVDFSINGLKILTDNASKFTIRDRVTLEFSGFNRKFRTAKLKAEPYQVVAITPNGYICLCRDHRVSQHKAASFLKRLIERNIDVLEHCTGELWMSTKVRLVEAWMHE
ncbi:MAG: PilZ domain-containing protein, partial [Enterobacterales bacterium]|nr:PilZ domain-containing protein [Enterobacterales bacterium]